MRPVAASGSAPLRFSGRTAAGAPCEGFAWARVRVTAPAAVTTRALRSGEPLEGAVAVASREVLPGRSALASVPAGAVAARALGAGAVLDEAAVRTGPAAGEAVTVRVTVGALSVEQPGRVVPCQRGRACARLDSGRRVEGRFEDGRLLVETP
jgi:flagella basal body P-ring formation protein FlgA